jgi:hypothetical protein
MLDEENLSLAAALVDPAYVQMASHAANARRRLVNFFVVSVLF